MSGLGAHNIIAFLSFVAAALNVTLAAYVLYKNPRRRENQLFAGMALALAVWAFGDATYNVSGTAAARAFWVRFQAPGEVLFPALFLLLALVITPAYAMLRTRSSRALVVGAVCVPAAFALAAFYGTDWVFRFKTVGLASGLTTKGLLYWGYAAFSYALLLAALALYIYNYYRSRRLREKRIAQLMIAAVAVPLVVNVLENARLYRLSSTPCFFTIAAVVFAYGILRHQMFTEVEQVLKRSIVYFTLTVVITSAFVLTIVISERFVADYLSASGYLITTGFILLMVIVFEPLRRALMKAVDRLFFRKDYQYGQMLATLAQSLMELSSLDEISRTITDTLTDRMGLTGAALLYEPMEEGEWRGRTISGFVPDYLEGGAGAVRLEGGTLMVSAGGPAAGEAAFAVLEIPLVFEQGRVGTLLLGEKLSGYDFSFSDRSLLAAMAPQMAVALKNGALYQEVLEKQRRVNELMEKVAEAHEDERRRMARELHDGVAQSFLGVVYLSEFTLEELEHSAAKAREDLETLNRRAREGLEELRAVIDDLRPIPLEVLGLAGAAAKLVNDLQAEGQLSAALESGLAEGEKLPPLVEGNLYRILQECLNNVRKHAGATSVTVRLARDDGTVTMRVSDDGAGLGESAAALLSGHGMRSMRERAEEMGGRLLVQSEVKDGTTVTVEVPLSEEGDNG